MSNHPLVSVDWTDSCGASPRWRLDSDDPPEPVTCQSIGYLVRDTDSHIVIAPHRAVDGDGDDQWSGEMAIPKKAATRIQTMKAVGDE